MDTEPYSHSRLARARVSVRDGLMVAVSGRVR